MKKLQLYLFSFLLTLTSFAQSGGEVPFDENVRIGKLENGFTYYLRKNGYPENRLNFRLAVNAGSMQEDADQLGLAHFVEHMAFNGSKNFEKNDLVDFLQSIGVKFGADLNAYTSFEETVYILPIPTGDPAILDKGLTVLEDWASGISFDEEEVDKERGVVTEEWRLGQGAQQRMRDQYFPILFKDSRYAERLPIGTKDIIQNSSYEASKRFYKDWYRPDLMALVAVGDMDIDALEKEIIKRFSKLKPVKNPRAKESNKVPGHKETLVAITKDKENAFVAIQLIYKQDISESNTTKGFRASYLRQLYNQMLSQRLQELTQSAEPPFVFANTSYGGMVRTKDNYSSFAVVGENGLAKGLETLVVENERVKRFGFTKGELSRAIKNMDNSLEQQLNELGKTESRNYVSEYVRHFLEGEPSPGITYELSFFREMVPTIKLEEINSLAANWITDENRVIIVTGIDKEGVTLPTKEELLATLNGISATEIQPYEDNLSDEGLMSGTPAPGKVTDTKRNETVDITELTLSNGVKVVIKETDYKNDEILMSAFSLGGHSIYGDEDYYSASNASSIINQSGVKNFSSIDLDKLLTGKTVRVSSFIGSLREGFNGNAAPKDFETMLQLIHLYFTQPRKDETAFQSMISRNKMFFGNLMANPQFYYGDQVSKIMAQNHFRGGGFPTPEEMDKVDLDRVYEIYQDRFSNAGDFVFLFVGNINVQEATPLLESYLGSLPNTGRKETWKDLGIRPPKAPLEKEILKGTDPKSQVTINFVGERELTKKERYLLNALGEVLSNRLIDILREDESGVYTARARGSSSNKPYDNYRFNVSFPCGPDNVDKLIKATFSELDNIQKNGVKDEDIVKVQEGQRKDREENLKKNRYWINQLNSYYYNESDLDGFSDQEKFVKDLNSTDLQKIANDLLDLDKAIKIILNPEADK